ncbi:uncharacterized protein LOC116013371 isoform X1 [Ipomoea triloba]|uniref:uncharacterized protein LOC116013371 isoform X1 n=1 Tax=Ipomoea triloba TaxID=35885 RepID=UPI00125CEBC7|nr:uncharacterized protein LOC116013371 isoform X1 [Ipomoea triloba]XP_031108938.1 uncharacterized protein LOC116013371 isoform X1 [Ipomoea triloba]XP_031108939.1 uncharacterized protein LOC116013371 isoform X1 [Ipomoea triloba]
MANVVKSQVRLVLCPKCRKILEEPTEEIVYKCGGCDTVLQAKKRKNNNNTSTEPGVPETHPRDSKEKEISSLHQKDSSISSVDTLQSESCKSRYEIGECSKVRSGQKNFSGELQCSPQLSSSFHEIDGNSSSAREPIEQHEDECPVDGCSDGYENELRTVDRNFSDELSESNELKHRGTEVSSAPREAGEQMEDDECIRRCEYESEMESPEYTNSHAGSSPFTRSSHDDSEANANTGKSHSLSQESNISDPNDFAGHTLEYIEHTKSSGEIIPPECHEIEKPSPVQTEVDQSPLHEGVLSDTFVSVHPQQPEQSDKEIARSFDRISSVDTLDNLPLYSRPQPTVTHRDMPKSPATRSYYAYDGSASSCDGDSQVPSKFSQQVGWKFENAKLKIPDEFRSDDECKEDSVLSRKPRTHHPAKNCSQALPRRMHRAGEGRSQNQDKWAEPRRRDQTFGHRRQLMTDTSHGHGSPSALWQNDFRHHSSFYPSNMPPYADREKMELLRMVHDLENQLQKTRLSKGKASNRRFHTEDMHAPLYSDQFQPDADASHRRQCPIRCSQGQGFSSKIPRIPFSGEAVHYRHRGDCLCLHCSPQVWHCSSQLPLGSVCCNKSHLAACTNHNYVNAIHSSSQSPQHYPSPKWCHEPKSSDQTHQRQKDHELRKLHLGERYGKMRHVLPFAGGAPIVACHHCSELLQLPADFGLFKRRCYQLRCNACLKILTFDLQNRTHIAPNAITDDLLSENDSVYDMAEQPATLAPPPSEVGESSDLHERAPPQRCPHAESLSYSDDLGPSFCRSCSTEVEPSSVPRGRTTFNRKVSSASSMEDRKMKSVMRESQGKPAKNSWEHAESAAGPSNWGISSSEIEEVHPNAGSPLHRLMGYSTISQVLK